MSRKMDAEARKRKDRDKGFNIHYSAKFRREKAGGGVLGWSFGRGRTTGKGGLTAIIGTRFEGKRRALIGTSFSKGRACSSKGHFKGFLGLQSECSG